MAAPPIGSIAIPLPPRKVDCGFYHSASVCNLKPDGSALIDDSNAYANLWGRNKWNVLGIGGESDAHVPRVLDHRLLQQPADQGVYEVACGTHHTLFLVKEPSAMGGSVYAAGLGNRGRLGGPPAGGGSGPQEVQDIWFPKESPQRVPLKFDVLRIACGADHSLCMTTDGQLYAWGLNEDGRCGVGTANDVMAPTPVSSDRRFGHFAAGGRHTLLITAKRDTLDEDYGQLYACGCGEQGRLGLGDYTNELVPKRVHIVGGVKLRFVACGEAHSGVIGERRLWMFGAGSHGRLGLGDSIDVPVPRELISLAESDVMQVALGGFHSLALTGRQRALQSQRLFSWGVGDAMGTLPDGDVSEVLVPRMVNVHKNRDITAPIVQIAAGTYHSLLLLESGKVIAFGIGSSGRLGTGKNRNHSHPVPVKGLPGFALHFEHRRAALRHVSEKDAGILGSDADKKIKDPWAIAQIDCGATHTAALTRGGDLYTWGSADFGQLGLGSENPTNQWHPRLLKIPGAKSIVYMSVGYEHCLAISNIGELFAWGKGTRGQLGTSKTINMFVPERVFFPIENECVQCAAGDEHSAAIVRLPGESVYKLYTWGSCELGKLGLGADGAMSDVIVPQEVVVPCPDEETPVYVACGQDHTAVVCGAKTDTSRALPACGSLWTFGSGWYGRLGHGNTWNQSAPKQVGMDVEVRFVACGAYHTCAIEAPSEEAHKDASTAFDAACKDGDGGKTTAAAGNLWIWGQDSVCCEHEHVLSPLCFQRIDNQPPILSVNCGLKHTIVVTESLEVYAWGDNSYSQLGLGPQARKEVFMPDQLKTIPGNIVMYNGEAVMGTGYGHTVAFLHTKRTFAWGCQSCGRLGLDTATSKRIVPSMLQVRAEWSSLESMSGALAGAGAELSDEEDEEDDAPSSVSSKSRAPGGSKAMSKKGEESAATAKMVAAVKSGQQVQKFSTLQMLLKREPEESKEYSLVKMEAELIRQLTQRSRAIFVLPEKERVIAKLRADFEYSLKQNLNYIKGMLPPETTCATPLAFSPKLPLYEELVWILQQQAAYLSSLSMCLQTDASLQSIFSRMVSCIYAKLKNERVLRLFITMLKLMISKEIEQAKRMDDIFIPEHSRAFSTLSWFALHDVHFRYVVHPIMDCTLWKDNGRIPVSVMAAIVNQTNNGQIFALKKEEFKNALQKKLTPDSSKDLSPTELTTEFHDCLDKLKDFLLVDLLGTIKPLFLHPNLNLIFMYTSKEIKKRSFAELASADRAISSELKICEPLVVFFVKGILVPMLSHTGKYCGKQVGLGKCEKEPVSDPLTVHNLGVITSFFNELAGDAFENKNEQKVLAVTAKQMKIELLKFIYERISHASDNIETLLPIDAYAAHFDMEPLTILSTTSDLMKLSNMLSKYESKLKVSQVDSVGSLCKAIGHWKPDDIAAAEKDDVWHTLTMNTRFLLQEKWGRVMTTCKLSQCPVPPMLSNLWGTELYDENANVAIRTYVANDRYRFLEDLFRDSEPFQATTMEDLKEEIGDLLGKSKEDHNVTRLLHNGFQHIEDLIRQEVTTADMLHSMVDAITARDSHRQYLEDVRMGMSRINEAEGRHAQALAKAESELRQALKASRKVSVPEIIDQTARSNGCELKFARISKHLEKVDQVQRKGLEGVSFNPQRAYTLSQLTQSNVVLDSQGALKRIRESDIQVTFCIMEAGVDVTIAMKRGSLKTVLKKVRLSQDKLTELRRCKEGETCPLPQEEPLLICAADNLLALLSALTTSK